MDLKSSQWSSLVIRLVMIVSFLYGCLGFGQILAIEHCQYVQSDSLSSMLTGNPLSFLRGIMEYLCDFCLSNCCEKLFVHFSDSLLQKSSCQLNISLLLQLKLVSWQLLLLPLTSFKSILPTLLVLSFRGVSERVNSLLGVVFLSSDSVNCAWFYLFARSSFLLESVARLRELCNFDFSGIRICQTTFSCLCFLGFINSKLGNYNLTAIINHKYQYDVFLPLDCRNIIKLHKYSEMIFLGC